MATKRYGIFGGSTCERDDQGYVTMWAVIEESGLYAGIPPEEVRIREVLPLDMFEDEGELKKILDETNKTRDLPYYAKKVKVKVLPEKGFPDKTV